jgi:hypothetical protein
MSRAFAPVEALTARHVLEGFDCGDAARSQWLRNHALESHRSGRSRVYVVRGLDESDQRVVGFYALATATVFNVDEFNVDDDAVADESVPAIVLTRLGVDLSVEPEGLSRALAIDALRRIAVAGPDFGVRAVIVHCGDEATRDFYTTLAPFPQSLTDSTHLLIPLNTLQRALES